jgi:hypothetical protein
MNIKETLRDIIREEITKVMNEAKASLHEFEIRRLAPGESAREYNSKLQPNSAFRKQLSAADRSDLAISTRNNVKQINTILKPYNLAIKAKSNSTDQVSGVFLDPKMKWEDTWALRLSNVLLYLKGEKVKSPFNYVTDAKMQKYFDKFFKMISPADKKKIIDILK